MYRQGIFAPWLYLRRHRLFLNFEGQALGITTDHVIQEVLQALEASA